MEQGQASELEDGEILDENEESKSDEEYEHRFDYDKRKGDRRAGHGGKQRGSRQNRYHQSRSQQASVSRNHRGKRISSYSRSRSRGSASNYHHNSNGYEGGSSKRAPNSLSRRSSTKKGRHYNKSKKKRSRKKTRRGSRGAYHDGNVSDASFKQKRRKRKHKNLPDYSRSVESLPSKGDAVHDRNYTGLIENSRQAVPVDQSEYVAAGLNSLSNGSSVPNGCAPYGNETEPVSDDDSSVLVVPEEEIAALRKSPLIITLDTTDTSDDDIDNKETDKHPLPASTADTCISMNTVEEHSIQHQVHIEETSDAPQVTYSEKQDDSISIPETSSNIPVETSSGDLDTTRQTEIDKGEESEEDMYVLELRNKLLADLVEKTVKYETSDTNSETSSQTGLKENTNENISAPNEDNQDEEENALREVLLSQIAIKKQKLQRGFVHGNWVRVDISDNQASRNESCSLTSNQHSESPINFVIESAYSTGSEKMADSPESPPPSSDLMQTLGQIGELSNNGNASIVQGFLIPSNTSIQATGELSMRGSDSLETSWSRRPTSLAGAPSSSRRGGRRGKRGGQQQRNKGKKGDVGLDGTANIPLSGPPHASRIVRLENETLRNPPHSNVSNRPVNVRNLSDNDLRNKLLRNRRIEQQQHDLLSTLLPEFGISDTDMRQEVGNRRLDPASDMTIRRTVNFVDTSPCASTTSAASTAITYMAPITVEIPSDMITSHSIHSPRLPTGMAQASPFLAQQSPRIRSNQPSPSIRTQQQLMSPHQQQLMATLLNQTRQINPFGFSSQPINAPHGFVATASPRDPVYSNSATMGTATVTSSAFSTSQFVSGDVDQRFSQQLGLPLWTERLLETTTVHERDSITDSQTSPLPFTTGDFNPQHNENVLNLGWCSSAPEAMELLVHNPQASTSMSPTYISDAASARNFSREIPMQTKGLQTTLASVISAPAGVTRGRPASIYSSISSDSLQMDSHSSSGALNLPEMRIGTSSTVSAESNSYDECHLNLSSSDNGLMIRMPWASSNAAHRQPISFMVSNSGITNTISTSMSNPKIRVPAKQSTAQTPKRRGKKGPKTTRSKPTNEIVTHAIIVTTTVCTPQTSITTVCSPQTRPSRTNVKKSTSTILQAQTLPVISKSRASAINSETINTTTTAVLASTRAFPPAPYTTLAHEISLSRMELEAVKTMASFSSRPSNPNLITIRPSRALPASSLNSPKNTKVAETTTTASGRSAAPVMSSVVSSAAFKTEPGVAEKIPTLVLEEDAPNSMANAAAASAQETQAHDSITPSSSIKLAAGPLQQPSTATLQQAPSTSIEKPPLAPSTSIEKPPQAPSTSIEKPPQAPSTSIEKPPHAPSTSIEKPPHAPSTSIEKPPQAPSTSIEKPPQAPSTEKPPQAPSKEKPPQAPSKEKPPQAPSKETPPHAPSVETPPQASSADTTPQAPSPELSINNPSILKLQPSVALSAKESCSETQTASAAKNANTTQSIPTVQSRIAQPKEIILSTSGTTSSSTNLKHSENPLISAQTTTESSKESSGSLQANIPTTTSNIIENTARATATTAAVANNRKPMTVPVPRSSPTGLKVTDSPLLEICATTPLRESKLNQQNKSVKKATPALRKLPISLPKTMQSCGNESILPFVIRLPVELLQATKLAPPVSKLPSKGSAVQKRAATKSPQKRSRPNPGTPVNSKLAVVSSPLAARNSGQPKPVVPVVVPVAEGDTTEDEDEDGECSPVKKKPRDTNDRDPHANSSPNPYVSIDAGGQDFQSHLDKFLKNIRQNVANAERSSATKHALDVSSIFGEKVVQLKSKDTEVSAAAESNTITKDTATSISLESVRLAVTQAKSSIMNRTNVLKASVALDKVTDATPTRVAAKVTSPAKRKAGIAEPGLVHSNISKPKPILSIISTPRLGPSNIADASTNSKVVDSLNQRIRETRDQVQLSFKEKELLQTRQYCFDEFKCILRDLQHHTRLTNFDTKLGQDITDLEKKLAAMKKRRETLKLKAIDLNRTIREKCKSALNQKKGCLSLANEVKKLGDKIIGEKKYKVPDILVGNINELVRNLKTMDAKQTEDLQRERGVMFKQLVLDEGTFSSALPSSAMPPSVPTRLVNANLTQVLPTVASAPPSPNLVFPSTSQQASQPQNRKTEVVISTSSQPNNPKNVQNAEAVAKGEHGKQNQNPEVAEPRESGVLKMNVGAAPAVISLPSGSCEENDDEEEAGKEKQGDDVLVPEDRLLLVEGDILSGEWDGNMNTLEYKDATGYAVLQILNGKGTQDKLDPHTPICPEGLLKGSCKRENCNLQHI